MVKNVPLSEIIDNRFQPRSEFDPVALRSLADEIKAGGFWGSSLQGRRTKNGKVELVFGHRRLRALRLLKEPTAPIEIVDLSDADMALRALEENLQRQGLTDLDKADAVKRAVEAVVAERAAAGKPARGVILEVAKRLGLSHQWVSSLCEISASMDAESRGPIEAGHLTAKTALVAKQWGGERYVRTLAKQGKRSKTDGAVPKPTHVSVAAMQQAVAKVPEPVREQVKALIVSGEIADPAKVETRARQLAAARTKRQKTPPPDLKIVIVEWTSRVKEWEEQMRAVAPYMDYVDDEAPAIGERFRVELRKLVKTAEKFL